MKKIYNLSMWVIKMLLIAVMCITTKNGGAQVCSDPANVIYGFSSSGQIRPITVNTGIAGAAINPAYSNPPPSYANAAGYNTLNGRFYFFKRNPFVNQVFMSFDPATNTYQTLAPSPASSSAIINLGCVNGSGLYYYCLDALGVLYCYSIATNTWTTICSNIMDESSTTLASIIDASGASPRYMGDLAMDGFGNMWMLISGASDYGLYKIDAPIPTTAVANLTARQILPPTTAAPMGSFGGIAFNSTGQVLMSSNSPDNRLFRMNDDYSLTFISTLSVDGIGNDLTSCNFPMFVLSAKDYIFSVSLNNDNGALISWMITQSLNTNGYTIEYSMDGKQWEKIAFIQKNGRDLSKTYSYAHSNLVKGIHYYRLSVTEYSGTINYSTIKKVEVQQEGSFALWPNPVSYELNVQKSVFEEDKSYLYLHDISGKLINIITLKTGVNKIDLTRVPAGIYVASIPSSNGKIINKKFIKK